MVHVLKEYYILPFGSKIIVFISSEKIGNGVHHVSTLLSKPDKIKCSFRDSDGRKMTESFPSSTQCLKNVNPSSLNYHEYAYKSKTSRQKTNKITHFPFSPSSSTNDM